MLLDEIDTTVPPGIPKTSTTNYEQLSKELPLLNNQGLPLLVAPGTQKIHETVLKYLLSS